MIISESSVNMSSQRSYSRKTQHSRTTFTWTGNSRQKMVSSYSDTSYLSTRQYHGSDYFPSYNRFGQELPDGAAGSYIEPEPQDTVDEDVSSASGANARINPLEDIKGNYESLTVTLLRLIDIIRNSRLKMSMMRSPYWNVLGAPYQRQGAFSVTSSSGATVWNRVVTKDTYSIEENESAAYTAQGTAVTADGRKISFDVTMEMSRSFMQTLELEHFDTYQQILTDPLVINLNSNPASVTDKTFFFDLDCDGAKEEIAGLANGSGYLALDKNNDGVINDGSELFGTSTGNGFAELSQYDSDNNGWIDEADEIYNSLKVWVRDENGGSTLLSLKDADIGAINLGSSKTEFSIKNGDKLSGMVRATGMYLKESGGTGTVQQIDF